MVSSSLAMQRELEIDQRMSQTTGTPCPKYMVLSVGATTAVPFTCDSCYLSPFFCQSKLKQVLFANLEGIPLTKTTLAETPFLFSQDQKDSGALVPESTSSAPRDSLVRKKEPTWGASVLGLCGVC